jgi:hypothetical protein
MPNDGQTVSDDLQLMNRLLIRAAQALGDEGQPELACRIVAAAWAALVDARPEEAEELNRTLHRLIHPNLEERRQTPKSGLAAT